MGKKRKSTESPKLALVRESKLHALLAGESEDSRLEASGVFAVDASTCFVAFDNRTEIARVDLSLENTETNKLVTVLSPAEGFEAISYDPKHERFYLLVEATKDVDGRYRGLVSEYDHNFEFQVCFRLDTAFEGRNKGFEGLAHNRHDGVEQLWALCEGNDCRSAEKGLGRIQVYRRDEQARWVHSHTVTLPANASFRDYAGIALRGRRVAIVSQKSRRLWVGELDESWREFRDDGVTFSFPKKSYRTVEGVSWLSDTRLAAVSDRIKGKRTDGRAKRDQSIHVFDIPPLSHSALA